MDPHTTSTKTRTCPECHIDSKTLGLGYGSISASGDSWTFSPATRSDPDVFGQDRRLDAFVDTGGRPLVHASRRGLRPFSAQELDRIVQVGLCLPCHRDFDDPVMRNWNRSSRPEPCSRFYDTFGIGH